MKTIALSPLLPILALLSGTLRAAPTDAQVVPRIDTAATNAHYVGNRPPLAASPLLKLPIGAVRPEGWIRRMLELQSAGFHGHLTEISDFLKKDNNAWLNTGKRERGWEEPPYWLKGFQDCAVLLQHPEQMREARLWIEAAFASQLPDGWFGPGEGRTGLATDLSGRADLWPNMIMLFCLQSFHEQTADPRVIELMTKYFRYLANVPDDQFLPGYWPKMRAGDQIHSLFWLYNRTGDPWLLDLARKTHRHAARWDEGVINWHNVNLAQGFREPTVYFQLSHEPKHLDAADRNWRQVRETYGQVPGGMFGSDENCRAGYTGPRQAIESCGIVEEMLSDEILLGITGDLVWADRCEDVAFNSLPAALTADFKALRYLTAPNQPQSDHVSKSPGIQNGGPMYHMNPHDHRCCQHNVGHGWPYFAQHLWYATPDNGLAAVLHGPSRVTARVGAPARGAAGSVTIRTTTRYPFEETLLYEIAEGTAEFPLYLRVPGWCEKAQVRVNGRKTASGKPGQFIRLQRRWRTGDTIKLTLPMTPRLQHWAKNQDTVSVSRGPLTYSLLIQERYERHGGTDAWPAWDIYPDSPWNFGLALPEEDWAPKALITPNFKRVDYLPGNGPAPSELDKIFRVVNKPWPKDDQPWTPASAPIQLKTKGRRIPQWRLDEKGLVREVGPSPVRAPGRDQPIHLIPMGAARLRIAAFPTIATRSDGHDWTQPPPVTISASHCNDSDSVAAANDGLTPRSSADDSLPRFTWWDRRGTTEWIQWTFEQPRTLSRCHVYWFDDTGRGQCRVPQSWRVLARSNQQWVPVKMKATPPVTPNTFNTVVFDRVDTDALRLEVQLQPGFSGGILEWQIPAPY